MIMIVIGLYADMSNLYVADEFKNDPRNPNFGKKH